MQSPPTGRARLGVDIGGTFTDLVWVDETAGAVRVGKLLTTSERYGVQTGMRFGGPAIIEERESTTVIGPRARISVDARLNLLAEPFP